jgi:hypothetical protein
VQLRDLDVVEAPANKGEVCLIEIRCPREFGTGDMGKRMAIEIVEHLMREGDDEDGKDDVEEEVEEAQRHLRNRKSHGVDPT